MKVLVQCLPGRAFSPHPFQELRCRGSPGMDSTHNISHPRKGSEAGHLLWCIQPGMARKRAPSGYFTESTRRRKIRLFYKRPFFIEQPSLIRRILKHLDLWEDPRPPPEPLEMVCEPNLDYVPWQDDVPEIEAG